MYNIFTLKNGLRVVVENIDYVNSVSVGLWIQNGSRNETINNNGISHFIEHMLFKGTKKRTAKDLAEVVEDVGGQINAFTGKESTCFYIKILDSHLRLSLDVLSDMLFNSLFDEEEIEKEKSVVVEEIGMSEDSPEDVLSDLHCNAIWGEDSISLPILGTIDTVRSFKREDLIQYVNSHYIPENAVISICGKFDSRSIQSLVEEYFGNWKSGNKIITNYTTPNILEQSLYKNKNIEQLHISLGLQGLPIGNDMVYTLLLVNNVLGGGVSSILFQKVREEFGLCYSIYSYTSSYKNTGILSIYTSLNPNYAKDAISIIKDELHAYSVNGIGNEKLMKAKEQIKGNYILGLESTSSRMFSNGKSVLFLNLVNSPEDIMKKIDNINQNKVTEILSKIIEKGILNSAFVGKNADLAVSNLDLAKSKVAFENPAKKEV